MHTLVVLLVCLILFGPISNGIYFFCIYHCFLWKCPLYSFIFEDCYKSNISSLSFLIHPCIVLHFTGVPWSSFFSESFHSFLISSSLLIFHGGCFVLLSIGLILFHIMLFCLILLSLGFSAFDFSSFICSFQTYQETLFSPFVCFPYILWSLVIFDASFTKQHWYSFYLLQRLVILINFMSIFCLLFFAVFKFIPVLLTNNSVSSQQQNP